MKDKLWAIFSKLIPFIGLALFVYLIWSIGPFKIWGQLTKIKIEYFVLASILIIPRFTIAAYAWFFICKKQKIDVDFFYIFKIMMINFFYGMVTPGSIGYHLRIFYLKKKSKESFAKCFANSILDMVINMIIMALLALFGVIVLIYYLSAYFPIIFGYFLFITIVFIVFIKKKSGSKIGSFFLRFLIPSKYKEKFGKSIDSVYEDMPLIRDLWLPFVFNIFNWVIASIQVYIIALSFNLQIGFLEFLAVHMISMVFTIILPISVGGLGIREAPFVEMLGRLGLAVGTGTAMAISLGGFIIKSVIPSFIGLTILLFNRDK